MRRYVVTGEHNVPSDFEEYVFDQLKNREPLTLFATEQQDDLSRKRAPAIEQEFTFRIQAVHTEDFYVHVKDGEGHFITIEAGTYVSFAIIE